MMGSIPIRATKDIMVYRKLRSEPTLWSFVKYCVEHPEERFWQALRNWSQYAAILTGSFQEGGDWRLIADKDTFNWEGRRHDDVVEKV